MSAITINGTVYRSYLEGNAAPTPDTLLNQGNTIVGATNALNIIDQATVPPTAIVQPTGDLTATTATLNGGVNPHGSATSVSFVYSTNSTLTNGPTTPAQSIGSGTSAVAVSAP